jgi:hypothetical protein
VAETPGSYTGKYLAPYLSPRRTRRSGTRGR